MKKTTLIPATAAVLALAYPAATWYMGTQLEAHLDETYRVVAEHPMIKIVERKFSRGVFSSDETVTLEFPTIPLDDKGAKDGASPGKPLRLSFQTHYRHGPLPGLSSIGKAGFTSELLIPADLQASVREVFGDQKPLLIAGSYAFDGSSRTQITSPAVSYQLTEEKFGFPATLQWQGLSGQIESDGKLRESRFTLNLPGLLLKQSDNDQLAINGIRLEGTQRKLFEDDPLLNGGQTTLSIDEININTQGKGDTPAFSLKIKQATEQSRVDLTGEHIDIALKIAANTLQINNQNYAPAVLDCAWRHIQARGLSQVYRQFAQLSSQVPTNNPEANGLLLFEKIKQPLLAILRDSPAFSIDQLSFQTPDGPARLSASAKLGQLDGDALENPQVWLNALLAEARVSLPKSLAQSQSSPEQIDALITQGILTQEGNLLTSKAQLSKDGLLINGTKVGPNPLMGQAAQSDD